MGWVQAALPLRTAGRRDQTKVEVLESRQMACLRWCEPAQAPARAWKKDLRWTIRKSDSLSASTLCSITLRQPTPGPRSRSTACSVRTPCWTAAHWRKRRVCASVATTDQSVCQCKGRRVTGSCLRQTLEIKSLWTTNLWKDSWRPRRPASPQKSGTRGRTTEFSSSCRGRLRWIWWICMRSAVNLSVCWRFAQNRCSGRIAIKLNSPSSTRGPTSSSRTCQKTRTGNGTSIYTSHGENIRSRGEGERTRWGNSPSLEKSLISSVM